MFNENTNAQESVLRVMLFVVGLYYLQLSIATIGRGEIRFHVPNYTVIPSNEPAIFGQFALFTR